MAAMASLGDLTEASFRTTYVSIQGIINVMGMYFHSFPVRVTTYYLILPPGGSTGYVDDTKDALEGELSVA